MDAFEATNHSTHCPFKGDASYWSLGDTPEGENLAWAYPTPFDQVEAIRDHLSFYTDRVEIRTDTD